MDFTRMQFDAEFAQANWSPEAIAALRLSMPHFQHGSSVKLPISELMSLLDDIEAARNSWLKLAKTNAHLSSESYLDYEISLREKTQKKVD